MSKIKFELNRDGVRALMQSPEAQALMLEKAEQIRDRCPDLGYEADV